MSALPCAATFSERGFFLEYDDRLGCFALSFPLPYLTQNPAILGERPDLLRKNLFPSLVFDDIENEGIAIPSHLGVKLIPVQAFVDKLRSANFIFEIQCAYTLRGPVRYLHR